MTDNLAAQAEAAARERRAALVGSPWERQKFPMSDAKLESETVFLESLAAELRSQQQVIEAQAEGLRINDETVSKLGAELRKKDAENAKMREALKQYELDPCNCEPDSGKPSCPACYTRAALASNAGADFLAGHAHIVNVLHQEQARADRLDAERAFLTDQCQQKEFAIRQLVTDKERLLKRLAAAENLIRLWLGYDSIGIHDDVASVKAAIATWRSLRDAQEREEP